MRTYILALTKYGIVAIVMAYTILSLYLLTQKKRSKIQVLSFAQNLLILLFQLISYFTLFVALDERRYILFCFLVMVSFFAIFTLYQRLYEFANMPLLNNMCMLLSIGLVIQSRLSFDNAIHQFVIAAMGLAIAFILPLFRKGFYLLKKPKYIYAVIGVLILGGVMVLGSTTLGANITYTIAGVTFQPSEFVKIIYVLFLASALPDVKDFRSFVLVSIFAAAHVLVLIGSRDLGSALIFYVVYMFMAFMATGWWMILVGCTGLGIIGAVACYFMFDHIRERVIAFLDPFNDEIIAVEGYQITQSLFAISAGGLWGSGLGQGSAQDIPFVDSDFIFAAICEELGQLVGVCVLLIGICCFIVMMQLAAGFADRFYRLTAYGAGIAYIFQVFLTVGGQTKFIPLTGVTLPFISYGGSSILSTLILFTLVESMCILRGEKISEVEKRRMRLRDQDSRRGSRYAEGRSYRRAGRTGYQERYSREDDYSGRRRDDDRQGYEYTPRRSGYADSRRLPDREYGSSYPQRALPDNSRNEGYWDED